LTEKILYVNVNNTWQYLSKHEFTYDTNENLVLEIFYYWDNANWINSTKTEYTYNTFKVL